ncbi:MAG: DUF4249 family protein [Cyclobacteriaceae bacterium]
MKYRVLIASILTISLFTSCGEEEFDPATSDVVIVEAYLYANEPIGNVSISQLIPFITEEDETFEVEDAQVFITSGNESYQLTHDEETPGTYYYNNPDYIVVPGTSYDITLDYFGKTISATTTVPPAPINLEVSVDSIEVAPIESRDDLIDRPTLDPIEIYWENTSGDYYYVLIENIENSPQDINTLDFRGPQRNFNFVTQPTNLDVHNVPPFSLTQYGTYQIVVYRVGQEYVDLYQTADQDSRNLTEPFSNINNGLGIFTSFNSDTVYFEITRP